jgi:hypothetical protein
MDISDFLPMPPQFGPPLPRFLACYWPWVEERTLLSTGPLRREFIGPTPKTDTQRAGSHYGVTEEEYLRHPESYPLPPRGTGLLSPTSYINEETTDITWNDDGLPVRIVRHRKALRQ